MSTGVKINKSLYPLSFLYGLGVWVRNKFFDWKILPSEEFVIPVISVGNLTIGGTGKTPHIEYLIHVLKNSYKIAVLSRGYKRKSSGFILANETSTSNEIGDEPYQIFRKYKNIIVAVDGNRRRGIQKLLSMPEENRPDIILLDDGFQHRYVKPSFSILLTDMHRLIYEDALLPAGHLREPLSEKSRANMVIVTKCDSNLKPIDFRVVSKHLNLFPYQDLFFTSFEYGRLTHGFYPDINESIDLEFLRSNKYSVLLIAGIANPEGIISKIETYTKYLESIIFADHHSFSKTDIENIELKFNNVKNDHKIIITTEKDFVRLIDCEFMTENIKKYLYYLPVKVVFKENQEQLFIQKIKNHVRNIERDCRLAQTTHRS